jgi:ankyrin repeat protein
LIFRHPQKTLFDFLVKELKTPIDELDYQGRTPFLINVLANPNQSPEDEIVKYMLGMNLKFELTDSRGRSPFLIFSENQNSAMAYKMIERGADVNRVDN